MKQFTKLLALTLALMMSLSVLSACGGKQGEDEKPDDSQGQVEAPADQDTQDKEEPQDAEEPAEDPHAGEWSFTDSLGRTVTFNGHITKVAPSGNLSQQCLIALDPSVIIGLQADLKENEIPYYPENFKDLPVFGTFYGKKANFNRESVLAAEPQVIIDIGEQKKNMKEDLDALQEQLGIPVVFIEASLETTGSAFTTLGELLDKPQEAKALADYCDAAIADAKEKAASIPEADRKTVYYGVMESGLTTSPVGSFHTEVLDLVGAVNVAPADLGGGFADIDMETLMTWDPEVIIFAPYSYYPSLKEDAGNWAELSAYKNGTYYEVPGKPCSWIDQPPAANRFIGIKWLGNLLYPEVFDYDMVKEAQTFYDLFYHYELTEDAARELMAESTFRGQ